MEIEKLVVKISADVEGLKSALKEAGIKVDEATKNIKDKTKDAATSSNSNLSKVGSGIKKAFSSIGNIIKKPMDKVKGILKESFNKIKGMFEQAFTFGILSKQFAEFGQTITNYIGNNEALTNALSGLKASFLTAVQPIVEVVIPILEKLVTKLTSVMTAVASLTTKLTGRTIKATKEEAKALEAMGKASSKATASFDELQTLSSSSDVSETDYSAVEEAEEKQITLIEMIKTAISEIPKKVLDACNKAVEYISTIDIASKFNESIEELEFDVIWEKTVALIANITTLVTNFVAHLDWGKIAGDLIEGVTTLINSITTTISNIDWVALGESIMDIIFTALEKVFNGDLIAAWSKLHGAILAAVLQLIVGIGAKLIEGIKTLINNIKQNGFWNTIVDLFKNLIIKPTKALFEGFWNALPDGFKNAFKKAGNFIIDILNTISNAFAGIINFIIGGLNKISIKIPDWIPTIGGKTFGINIPTVQAKQIPKLATGGIINKPTTVMAGESGAEAVLPLENNTGWMDKLANVFAEKLVDNSETKVVLNVDGNQLGWTTIKNINSITKQTGNLQLALN